MPDVSIVIPVYNEEGILREAVTELLDGLDTVRAALHEPALTFEIILAENGSRDRTAELAARLSEERAGERDVVRSFSLGEPNYGKPAIAPRYGVGLLDEDAPRTTSGASRRTPASGRWLPSALGELRQACQVRTSPPRPQALRLVPEILFSGESERLELRRKISADS